MNRRAPQDPREAALQRLVRDARAEPAPDLDWSRIEQRLPSQAPQPVRPVKSTPPPLTWGLLAVAAVAAIWAIGTRPHALVSQAPEAIIEGAAALHQSGDALPLGSRVEADAREVSVEHSGRATWTLSAHSSALLAGKDERINVRLERGSVLSRVVPNPKPETFVIEAAGTRVAVHGTVFRVTLEGERVLVQVREGTVAVGPLGSPPEFLLKAPAIGNFASDGRSGSIDGQWVSESRTRRTGRLKVVRSGSSAAAAPGSALAPIPSAELPSEPSISDIEVGITRIVDATSDCFRRHTPSADGVEITARTALGLNILDSGAIADIDFQPPLSPDAEACAAASIARVAFAPSKQGAKVTRLLELKK